MIFTTGIILLIPTITAMQKAARDNVDLRTIYNVHILCCDCSHALLIARALMTLYRAPLLTIRVITRHRVLAKLARRAPKSIPQKHGRNSSPPDQRSPHVHSTLSTCSRTLLTRYLPRSAKM